MTDDLLGARDAAAYLEMDPHTFRMAVWRETGPPADDEQSTPQGVVRRWTRATLDEWDRARRRRPVFPELRDPEWLAAAIREKSVKQVAELVGCWPSAVSRAVGRLGVENPRATT